MNEQELKESMGIVIENILSKASKDARSDPLYKFISEQKPWLGNPEEMYVMIVAKLYGIIQECVRESLQTADYTVQSIFTHWAFFDDHVTVLCERLYGPMGSADKGRFIVKSYIKYKLTGELPVFDPESGNYHHPKTRTPQMWMNFIEAIAAVQLGNPTQYLLTYQVLLGKDK
jgi:hypothetical protein